MKKIISIISSICLFLILCLPAYAFGQDAEKDIKQNTYEKINDALNYVELDKKQFGLERIDFYSLETSSPIQMYEVSHGTISRIGETYPIFSSGKMVALATSPDGSNYCIETYLAKAIQKTEIQKIALIYDSDEVFLYDGIKLISLCKNPEIMVDRNNFIDKRLIDHSSILVSDTNNRILLKYGGSKKQNRSNYYSCDVSLVSQKGYANLCWAATVACIKNYISGTSWTVHTVSKGYFQTTYTVDATVETSSVANFMQNKCSMPYTYHNSVPSDNTILSNIIGGYPIYGSFYVSPNNLWHAGTIYGINVVSGYISVKDPLRGTVSAISNGSTYVYTIASTGKTYTLQKVITHTW